MLGAAGNTLNAAAKVVKNTTGKRGRPKGVLNGQGKIREMKRYNGAGQKYMRKKATTKSGQSIYILNDFTNAEKPKQYSTTVNGVRNRIIQVLRSIPKQYYNNCYFTLYSYNLRPIYENRVSGPTILKWADEEILKWRQAHPRKKKN